MSGFDNDTDATAESVDLAAALQQRFGFTKFNPGQREVIEHLMAGRSAAAVFATGAGKSLCYQLPATLLPGLTLVVSPLIALMKDQIGALAARGIAARNLDSSLSFDEYRTVMAELRSGKTRMLYVAPERFNNERFRASLEGVRISLFAVDEAHCISEWGHNFRPDYLKLSVFARELAAERVLALTATATEPVLDDICRSLSIDRACAVRTPFYRDNLTLLTSRVEASERDQVLLERIGERESGPTIVYVTLQRTAEEVAAQLRRAGIDAMPYHAGLGSELRASTQDWFLSSTDGVVVATIAFGMGIDKADIRYVYHYNLPKSLENFSQEIGRAGRDGAASICETLACADDLIVLENFVYGDTPTLAAITGMLDSIFDQDEDFDVSLTGLSREHGIRILVVRTLLTYLELRGHIAGGTPFYSAYELKPLMSSAQMLAQIDERERPLARAVLACARKARTWFHLDAAEAVRTVGAPRGTVVRILDQLAERQMIELRSKGVRHRYRRERVPDDLPTLARELHRQTVDRETSETRRLQQVVDLIGHQGCQVSALGGHFSEPLAQPCGHCTWCTTGATSPLADATRPNIDPNVWQRALTLRENHAAVLSDPRTLAQLLCGIPSPALSKARLSKHALFGAQSRVPFATVLAAAS